MGGNDKKIFEIVIKQIFQNKKVRLKTSLNGLFCLFATLIISYLCHQTKNKPLSVLSSSQC